MSHQKEVTQTATVDESNWRQELEYLDRILTDRPNEREEKEIVNSIIAEHDQIIRSIEEKIKQAKAALTDADLFISGGDKKQIQNKIEDLEYRLNEARGQRERSIRLGGGSIKTAASVDKQRGRWEELKKRRDTIERAQRVAKRSSW
jgi:hypothetical protein